MPCTPHIRVLTHTQPDCPLSPLCPSSFRFLPLDMPLVGSVSPRVELRPRLKDRGPHWCENRPPAGTNLTARVWSLAVLHLALLPQKTPCFDPGLVWTGAF